MNNALGWIGVLGFWGLQCGDVDQASAALIQDLKQRGMLDETLVIWGGEFGRTVYAQGGLDMKRYGRDHHPRCFSMWLAGGGIKPGVTSERLDARLWKTDVWISHHG